MKVTVRHAVPSAEGRPKRVVIETWMEREEAEILSLQPTLTGFEEAQKRALDEHLKTGYRVTHKVDNEGGR